MSPEEELIDLKEQYAEISKQMDALKEQKRAVSLMIAEKENLIEEEKRAGWGQVIG